MRRLPKKLASPLPQSPFVRFYRDCIGSSLNGELMGCALADIESGKLTMNVGTIGVTDGSLVMEIDVRAPVTFEADAVTEPLRRAAAEYGIEVTLTQDTPPVYMDKNGNVRPVDTKNTRQKRRSKHECLRCDGLVYTKYACAAAPRPRTCSVFFGALQF